MRRAGMLPVLLLVVPMTATAAARLTFTRVIPPRQGVAGVEDLALRNGVGDAEGIATFIEVFLEQSNRSGLLRVYDNTRREPLLPPRGRHRARPFMPPPHVGTTLRITSFACRTIDRAGEGSSYDVDGNRVRRRLEWADAVCTAQIDGFAGSPEKKVLTLKSRGEGTSPRVTDLSSEDRATAVDQAARYAAVLAAEDITPRQVRESIDLDEKAPRFEEGMALISADRLEEARRLWESALAGNRRSAALHFNTAAVCEALGDVEAAGRHYEAALKLAPSDERFQDEYDRFLYRNRTKKTKKAALPRGPG